MALIDTADAAQRLARTIAGDIALYNEDKIIQGLTNDTLFDLLATELEEGLNHYKTRVTPEIFASSNWYWRAIIDVVIKNKGHIRSRIW
ncbi:MAG: hypothetical protein HY791_23070 [Deltaproteobacteria bacterium]|nr:hypothetical protein [Deltaproteobacteria bacterium]